VKIDYRLLKKRCLDPIEAFHEEGDLELTENGPLIFVDRGAQVLGVAHLDTALPYADHFGIVRGDSFRGVVCPHLDDRLGAYILLDLLPSIGVKTDVLLTDGEEIGLSTGTHFVPRKEYHWIFSFDRSGTDVVLYRYEDPALVRLLKEYRFKVGYGTFSDICFMEHLGVKGINFGCGYVMQHTEWCAVDLDDTVAAVSRFKQFWKNNHTTRMAHAAKPRTEPEWYSDRLRIFQDPQPVFSQEPLHGCRKE